MLKNPPANAAHLRDAGSIPGSGRSPGEGNDNSRQYSCLGNPWTGEPGRLQSMGFSRQEYWSGLPFPSSEDLPNPGVEPGSPALQAGSLPSEPPGKPNCSTSMEYYRAFKGNELSSKKKHRGNLDIITGKKAS